MSESAEKKWMCFNGPPQRRARLGEEWQEQRQKKPEVRTGRSRVDRLKRGMAMG